MKLLDAIAKVNKSELEPFYGDLDGFNSALGTSYYGYTARIPLEMQYVYLVKWCCTDTHVGVCVYFLHGTPVAISTQSARKSDETIQFLSQADADRMRNFILSLEKDDNDNFDPILDPDTEIEDFYNIDYGSELLTDNGFYKGQPVTVVKKYTGYGNIDNWRHIDVKLNGEIITIRTDEFDIPLNLEQEG